MNIPDSLKQQILAHAWQTEPHESCGFVVLEGKEMRYLPCENIADKPEDYFEISPEDYLLAQQTGELVTLVHSHPNGLPTLSLADRQMQLQSDLDWWLVCNGKIYFFPKKAPLFGRDFKHGEQDCYSLFRDFYFLCGADLPDFERDEYWWEDGFNLYLDNMAIHGFERLNEQDDLQVGDVILMQVASDVPNHAGIYIGNQMVLHHSPKRLSKRDLYDGYWFKHTHSIWRYKQWLQLDCTAVLNSLASNTN